MIICPVMVNRGRIAKMLPIVRRGRSVVIKKANAREIKQKNPILHSAGKNLILYLTAALMRSQSGTIPANSRRNSA